MPTAAAQQKASGLDQLGAGHPARVVADQKRKYPTLPHPFWSSRAVHVPSGATFHTGVCGRGREFSRTVRKSAPAEFFHGRFVAIVEPVHDRVVLRQ